MKNLRFYLTTLGILFTILIGNAQINLGLSGGISSNTGVITGVSQSLAPDLDTYTGLKLALDLGYKLNDNWSINTGLGYGLSGTRIGAGTSLNTGVIDVPLGVEATMSSKNISLPLSLRYTQAINDQFAIYAKAGTSMDYATQGRIKTKVNLLFVDLTLSDTAINYGLNSFSRTTINGDLGLGAKFKYGSGMLFSELEYSHGFNGGFTDPLLGLEIKNRAVSLRLGYTHNI